MIKLQGFFVIASLALTLYTFIDCARRDETEIRKLPKWGWLLAILLTGIFGPIAYLVVGRNPLNNAPKKFKPQKRILPPDDDPDFLKGL
ncbi:Cardiolipin synthase N-terminal [Candidatus Nanopelagicaceae bacterium]